MRNNVQASSGGTAALLACILYSSLFFSSVLLYFAIIKNRVLTRSSQSGYAIFGLRTRVIEPVLEGRPGPRKSLKRWDLDWNHANTAPNLHLLKGGILRWPPLFFSAQRPSTIHQKTPKQGAILSKLNHCCEQSIDSYLYFWIFFLFRMQGRGPLSYWKLATELC